MWLCFLALIIRNTLLFFCTWKRPLKVTDRSLHCIPVLLSQDIQDNRQKINKHYSLCLQIGKLRVQCKFKKCSAVTFAASDRQLKRPSDIRSQPSDGNLSVKLELYSFAVVRRVNKVH